MRDDNDWNVPTQAQAVADVVNDMRFEATTHLAPCLFALHRQMVRAVPSGIVRRIVARETPIVIGVRSMVPTNDLSIAIRAAMEWIGAEAAPFTPPTIEILAERSDPDGERQSLTTALLHGRVLVLLRKTPSSTHGALLDADLTLGELDASSIRDTLEREFGPLELPEIGVWPAGLSHDVLDLACAKAGSAKAAWEIVSTIGERTGTDGNLSLVGARLEDLHGYGEALDWARDLIEDLAAYRSGTLVWSDISSSALLVGPPGTGKTHLAAAVARSAGLSFHPTSYASWQRAGDGHLGDVTMEMSRIFERAAATVPSLVFIDEIDSIPSRGSSRNSDAWWRSICNTLLELVDGSDRRRGIVVLAACNDDTLLDPALVRSGRLERRLAVPMPDAPAFAAILAGHLGGAIAPSELAAIASHAEGALTGADAARIARDARRRARRAGREVSVADVEGVLMPADSRSAEFVWRIAVHEAGHAVVALSSGMVPSRVSILPSVGSDIRSGGTVSAAFSSDGPLLAGHLDAQARFALGGRAAEDVILGAPSTGSGGSSASDLAVATSIVESALTSHGFGDRLAHGYKAPPDVVERRLQDLYRETVALVTYRRDDVEALAALLVKRRTLTRADLTSFASERTATALEG